MRAPMVLFLVLIMQISMGQLGAQTGSESDPLIALDALASFTDSDFYGEYQIIQEKPGQTRIVQIADVYRRDRDETYTIVFKKPEIDKGKGYLKVGNNLWLYDPVSKRFTVTSAKDRFQNSNARNSDFTRSTLATDYKVVAKAKAQLGAFDCILYDLEARGPGLATPRMKIWVSTDGLLRKSEDYSLSGQLLRTTLIPSYQKVGTRFVPVSVAMVDMLRGKKVDGKMVQERTVLSISKVSFEKQSNLVFDKSYLERESR